MAKRKLTQPMSEPTALAKAHGARFRRYREKSRLSLEQAAQIAGMSTGNLSAMERGKQGFTREGLHGLAKAYETTPGALIDLDPTDPRAIAMPYIAAATPRELEQITAMLKVIVAKRIP